MFYDVPRGKIPVFYSPKQVVHDDVGTSPSARKPEAVVASWSEKFPIHVIEPSPASLTDFCRAHDPTHVREVLGCVRPNGFGNRFPSVAASLPWTSGSMLSAARYVTLERAPVAVSPTSGFHHAGYASCDGFCTFNGLMVTALALRAYAVGKIGILDCDEHYGNGTDEIIQRLDVPNIHHYTFGAEFHMHRSDVAGWLAHLPSIVAGFAGCDVILYQAGADPHEDDPFSRGLLSTHQLYVRDQIVFREIKALGIPVVWNLAGGYQKPIRKVLDIHDNTMRACVETYLPGVLGVST